MIRKFLAREGEFLLEELGAPDARPLLWRGVSWVCFITATGTGVVGVVAVYEEFGLPAMNAVVFLFFLLCVRLERRGPVYFDDGGGLLALGGDSRPALPPAGRQALPPPAPRQITRSQRPALPGPKK